MSQYRKGYLLYMRTGPFPINANGQPVVFSTLASAKRTLSRYPEWGQAYAEIRKVRTRPGSNGKPDYIIGEEV